MVNVLKILADDMTFTVNLNAPMRMSLFTPAVRRFGTSLLNKASSVLSRNSASYDGINIPNYENPSGKDLIYYGHLRSGKPHGIGIAVLNDIDR